MSYDPFARGPRPAGVRTLELTDPTRDRTLPIEVWYPAAETHAGQDRDAAHWDSYDLLNGAQTVHQEAVRDAEPAADTGAPLIIFSHGLAGHRRQSTFFTTHLASHGYVVIAPDHVGNTLPDVMMQAMEGPSVVQAAVLQSAEDRRHDVPFLLAAFPGCGDRVAGMVDFTRVGLAGHSFGGWTTIVTTSGALPVRCALPLAPVGTGARAQLKGGDPYEGITLAYADRVPTLILAADRDALCELPTVERLHAALGDGHGMQVLRDADHFHFCDRALEVHAWFSSIAGSGGVTGTGSFTLAPVEELVAEAPAHDFVRGSGLAHFDAHLRANDAAATFLRTSATEALAARGATVTNHAPAAVRG